MNKNMISFFKTAIVILVCCVSFTNASAQDPHFSQFFTATQLYNPALVGAFDEDIRVSGHYRNQWSGPIKGYKTNAFNAEGNVLYLTELSYLSAGVFVLSDKAGVAQLGTFQALISGAYHLATSRKDQLNFGFQAGLLQRSINFDGLRWDAQYNGIEFDPALSNKEDILINKVWRYDVGAGFNWIHKGSRNYISLGYAVRHYMQNQTILLIGQDNLALRHTIQGAHEGATSWGKLRTEFLFQQQGEAVEVVLGMRGEYRIGSDSRYTKKSTSSALYGGLYYRVRDAVSPVFGFEFKRQFCGFVSFDIPLSRVAKISGIFGGPEFTLQYKLNFAQRKTKLVK
jgi:type IX secretion system PorP/SprF family membrane protein